MDADDARTRGSDVGRTPGTAGYPPDAITWLVGTRTARVLELGAGRGELTGVLCGRGLDVIAADPSPELVSELRDTAPPAHRVVARAHDLPLTASSVDSVVTADPVVDLERARALPEIARVLKPGGVFAVIRCSGDRKVPWVRKLLGLIGSSSGSAPEDPFESSGLLTLTERRSFRQWQRFYKSTLVSFVAASAKAATLSPADRDDLLTEAGELYDGYGRGPDGLLMPWLVDCYRARVKGRAGVVTSEATDDGLLIDFS